MKYLRITGSDGSETTVEVSTSKKKIPLYGECIEKPFYYLYGGFTGYYCIDKKTMRAVFSDGRIIKPIYFEILERGVVL